MGSCHAQWVSGREASAYLCISETTLSRWRKAYLIPGKHYRRHLLDSGSPLLYQLELCEKEMNKRCALDPQIMEFAA